VQVPPEFMVGCKWSVAPPEFEKIVPPRKKNSNADGKKMRHIVGCTAGDNLFMEICLFCQGGNFLWPPSTCEQNV